MFVIPALIALAIDLDLFIECLLKWIAHDSVPSRLLLLSPRYSWFMVAVLAGLHPMTNACAEC